MELLEILATCSSALSKPMRERGGGGKKEGEEETEQQGKEKRLGGGEQKEKVSLGRFPAGTHCHQGDQEEYAPSGQDDV